MAVKMSYLLIGILILAFVGNAFALTDANLVSWFKLNETSGTRMENAKNTANSGTIGGTNYVLGGPGANLLAYSSYGSSTYIDTNTTGGINGLNQGAIAAWVKASPGTALNDGIIISRGAGAGGLFAQSASLVYCLWNGTTADYSASGAIDGNIWHFVVCTMDGSRRRLYVDGAIITDQVTTTWSASANWNIGYDSAVSTRVFDGNLDEVSIWNKGLSNADINFLYNNRNALTYCSIDGNFWPTCPVRIDFNVYEQGTTTHLTDVNMDCTNNLYDKNGQTSPFFQNMVPATYTCNFNKTGYDSNTAYSFVVTTAATQVITLKSQASDPCARTLNADWNISTQIDCNFKSIDLGTGKLIISPGGRLRLYDSNIIVKQVKLMGHGNLIYLFARSFFKIK
jgi:hypothetical protein